MIHNRIQLKRKKIFILQFFKCQLSDVPRTAAFYDDVLKWLVEHINYPRWIPGVYPSEDSVRAMTQSGSQYICFLDHSQEDRVTALHYGPDNITDLIGKIAAAFALSDDVQGAFWKGNWSRDLENGQFAVIHALAIDPALQRMGLGSQIVRFCVEEAKAQGYQAMRVDIVPGNLPARSLFEKKGFAGSATWTWRWASKGSRCSVCTN